MTVLLDMGCSLSLNNSVRLADGSVKIHHTAMCPETPNATKGLYRRRQGAQAEEETSSLLYSGVLYIARLARKPSGQT